jgi:hypothetical protein
MRWLHDHRELDFPVAKEDFVPARGLEGDRCFTEKCHDNIFRVTCCRSIEPNYDADVGTRNGQGPASRECDGCTVYTFGGRDEGDVGPSFAAARFWTIWHSVTVKILVVRNAATANSRGREFGGIVWANVHTVCTGVPICVCVGKPTPADSRGGYFERVSITNIVAIGYSVSVRISIGHTASTNTRRRIFLWIGRASVYAVRSRISIGINIWFTATTFS